VKSQKRHKSGLGSQSSHNFLGWHPLDQQPSRTEKDRPVDFLLTRTRATPIQFAGSLILGLTFIAAAATIFFFVLASTNLTGLQRFWVLLAACPMSLLFLRLGWLSIRRAFVGRGKSSS
jgi:hypothetical protein